jgi:hypothetical protein
VLIPLLFLALLVVVMMQGPLWGALCYAMLGFLWIRYELEAPVPRPWTSNRAMVAAGFLLWPLAALICLLERTSFGFSVDDT